MLVIRQIPVHHIKLVFLLLFVPLIFYTRTATALTIGVVTDGPMTDLDRARELFFGEITALTEGEFDVRFPQAKQLNGNWSIDEIKSALSRLQNDSSVDMVLALGFVSSQIAATGIELRKPTFAPLVLDANLAGLPHKDSSSGVPLLNYLSEEVNLIDDLAVFSSIVDFERLALVVDATIFESVPDLAERGIAWTDESGIDLTYVLNTGLDEDLAAKIPADREAVMVGALPRLSDEARQRFIDGMIVRKLPSFSFVGTTPVERGMLAAQVPDSDWERLARRNALNIQAVLLGERAGDQPVFFSRKRQLTINMATARAIGLSPRFDVLSESVLLNEDVLSKGVKWSLSDVALEAVRANLDIQASLAGVAAGSEQVNETRSTLFPQLNASSDITQLDDGSVNVRSGFAAERSASAAIGLNQIIYSEATRAAVDVQEATQAARESSHRAVELDIVQEATTGFLNVLKAQTQLSISRRDLNLTRTNLDLARNRVSVGTANASDVFRWESELATSRQNLLSANAALNQAMDNLNRILSRDVGERFQTVPATLDDPALLVSRKDLLDLVNNQRAFDLMGEYFIQQGLAAAPELLQLDAQIAASERQLLSAERSFWSPEIGLSSQLSEVLEESRVTGESQEGENDWQIGINFSLPLFQGGARKAQVNRFTHELNQLQFQQDATRDRVKQSIRANLHAVRASFPSIELAQDAATAARKNLDLVRDNYSQGTVSIIDLLDAQNASLDAEQAATDAAYNFLIDLMNLQRSVAAFDFFLNDPRRNSAAQAIKDYISAGGVQKEIQ